MGYGRELMLRGKKRHASGSKRSASGRSELSDSTRSALKCKCAAPQ